MKAETTVDTVIRICLFVNKNGQSEAKDYIIFHDLDATSYCSMMHSQVLNHNLEIIEEWQTVTEQDFSFNEKTFFLQKDFEKLNLTEEEIIELCNKLVKAHDEEYEKRIKE